MKKLLFSFSIATLLLLLVIPFAFAAEKAQTSTIKPLLTMEKALVVAQKYFSISKDFKRDSTNYEEAPGRKVWSFNWSKNSVNLSQNIMVSIDADTGEVMNFSHNDSSDWQIYYDFSSTFTKEDAHAIALAALKKCAPSKVPFLKEIDIPDYQNVISGKREMKRYSFRYVRLINGITFDEDNVWITVTEKGKLTDFNCNWSKLKADLPTSKFTIAQAQDIFKEKLGLRLAYLEDYGNKSPNKPKLVYQVPNSVDFYINAQTGELENMAGISYSGNVAMGRGGEQNAKSEDKFYVGKAKIAKEDADGIIRTYIDIPEGYTNGGTEFRKDYLTGREMWILRYTKENPDKESYEIQAGVAADNGEILEINKYKPYVQPQADDIAKKLTYDDAKKMAQDFIEKIAPMRAKNVILDQDPSINQDKLPGGDMQSYYFHYSRYVNNIVVSGEGINLTIDAKNGEILNYRLDFIPGNIYPVPKNILPTDKMLAKFLKEPGLKLTYFRVYPQDYRGVSDSAYIKLGYRMPLDSPRSFDAVTGTPIYNDFQKPTPKVIYPKDIVNSKYKKAINKVVELKIMGGRTTTLFYPQKPITKIEFAKALLSAKGFIPDYSGTKLPYKDVPSNAWYAPYVRMALKQGIIISGSTLKPLASLSYEEAGVMSVRAMNYTKVANLKIFKYIQGVKKSNTGFVALAEGLQLFPEKTAYSSTITRGESAQLILNVLQNKN